MNTKGLMSYLRRWLRARVLRAQQRRQIRHMFEDELRRQRRKGKM